MPPKKKSPPRQHKTGRSKSKSPPRIAAAVGDKRRRSPSPKRAPAAAAPPLPTPSTSAARTFGALLPSMLDLPSSPIETTNIAMGFKSTTASLADDVVVAAYNEVNFIVPNLEVRDVPERAHPGYPFEFDLVINDAYAGTHPEAVKLLQNHTRVDAYINETREKLEFKCTPLVEDGLVGVTVCISIPPDTDFQHVIVSEIRVAGTVLPLGSRFPQTIDVLPGMHTEYQHVVLSGIRVTKHKHKSLWSFKLPLSRQIVPGMHAPQLFHSNTITDFTIATNGIMYALVASQSVAIQVIRVFTADGTERPPLSVLIDDASVDSLVFVDTLNMLLFTTRTRKTLIAFDIERQSIRWSTKVTSKGKIKCDKPSVLSTRGVCIITISTTEGDEIHVYSLDNGTLRFKGLATHLCDNPTCDPATSTWYAQMRVGGHLKIVPFQWNGTTLIAERNRGRISQDTGAMTVIPPTAGKHASFLVCIVPIFTSYSSRLQVYTLPDLRLVLSYHLQSVLDRMMCADPSGTSIAMVNYGDVRILSWPLPGMPALE
jgi:hypothetical protein